MRFVNYVRHGGCPTCGKTEGPFRIGHSLWGYCREHKVKWIAARNWHAMLNDLPTRDEAEEARLYDELGLGGFRYIGPDVEDYERFRQRRRSKGGAP